MMAHARRLLKSIAEKRFGVYVSRTPPGTPGKHADQAIRELRPWSARDVVFDVGANDGRTILRLNDLLSRPRFLAFEPASATYQTLVEQTARFPNVRTFRLALGATSGRQTMYLNAIDAMNSLSPGWSTAHKDTEVVEMKTIDEVMNEQGIEFIHLLKVDTEGHDLAVLQGAEAALRAARIAVIQVEVGVDQLPKAFPSLEEVRRHLETRQYFLYGIYNQCRTHARPPAEWAADALRGYRSEVLAYCDALFIRAHL
jgi:FkbM family methyltransferase